MNIIDFIKNLLGLLFIFAILALALGLAMGAEFRMLQGEPPAVAYWELYQWSSPTPVATVLPTQLVEITPPVTPYTPAPGTPPATVRAYRFDVPSIPEQVIIQAVAVGVGLDEEGNLLRSAVSNIFFTNSNTPTPSSTATVTATQTDTPTRTPTWTPTRTPTRTPTDTPTLVPTRTKKPKPHPPRLVP